MGIKQKPTLVEKQVFWAEQLPSFEAKYWLPSHFEFLNFDMDQGNYVIKNGLDPSFEGDATEIWHSVNTGWAMWKKAITFAKAQVPESNALLSASLDVIQKLGSGDFVLVPKELSENIAHQLAKSEFKKSEIIFNSYYRDFSTDAKNDLKQKWIEQKTRCIVVDYKTLIGKAQEQSHE